MEFELKNAKYSTYVGDFNNLVSNIFIRVMFLLHITK